MKKLLIPVASFCFMQATAQTILTKDNSFGDKGNLLITPSANQVDLQNHFITADDKILFGGTVHGFNKDLYIVKTDMNGSMDASFGNNGILMIDPQLGANEQGGYVVERPDGKIIIAGATYNGQDDDALVMCLNADGSIDPNFGNNGMSILPIGGNDIAVKVIVHSSKIYVGGASSVNGKYTNGFIIRLNLDGTLDQTFGSIGGIKLIDYKGREETLSDFEVLSDGSVVAIGRTRGNNDTKHYVCKLTAVGKYDTNFGTLGFLVHSEPTGVSNFQKIAVAPTGEIYIAGYYQDNNKDVAAVWSVNANGTMSNTFGGGNGKTVLNIGNNSLQRFWAIRVLNNGKLFIGGNFKYDMKIESYPLTAMLHPDGSFDTDFYTTGYFIDSLPPNQVLVALMSVSVTASGSVYVSGLSVDSLSDIRVLVNKFDKKSLNVANMDKSIVQIDLYPNPARSYVFIDVKKNSKISRVNLYDLSGKLLKSLSNTNNNQYALPTMLPIGNYAISIEFEEGTRVVKLVTID